MAKEATSGGEAEGLLAHGGGARPRGGLHGLRACLALVVIAGLTAATAYLAVRGRQETLVYVMNGTSVVYVCNETEIVYIYNNSYYGPIGCALPPAPPAGMHRALRERARIAFNASLAGGLLPGDALFMEGAPAGLTRIFSDTELDFRQESNFLYFTGFERPINAMVVMLANGTTILFVQEPSPTYALWNGVAYTRASLLASLDVDDVQWISELPSTAASWQTTRVFTLLNVQLTGVAAQAFVNATLVNGRTLLDAIALVRRIKTDDEISLMRSVSRATAASHARLMAIAGVLNYTNEYEVAADFEYGTGYCGMPRQAYLPITGGANRSAILHYLENNRGVAPGDLVLVDAACEYHGYGSDVTRTWPVGGHFTDRSRRIYNIVYAAQAAALERVRPGVTFSNVSATANEALVRGLLDAGLVWNGTVDDMVKAGAHRVFMPHGLGHSVGLDVHDPGSTTTLQAGMTITIEPGVYFVAAELASAMSRPVGKYIARLEFESYLNEGFGGVRIEDVVLVTNDERGHEVLSDNAPKHPDAIEALMASLAR